MNLIYVRPLLPLAFLWSQTCRGRTEGGWTGQKRSRGAGPWPSLPPSPDPTADPWTLSPEKTT